ncbi:MAG: hypothetical protein ACJ77K_06530 [Bacteroidia bacterium]
MKDNEKEHAKSLLDALKNDKHQLLVHLLSPLEREAISHGYYAFEYLVNNTPIQISTQSCKQLREVSIIKIALFSQILNDSSLYLVGADAKIQLFLDTPIEHFHFPTRLYHTLKTMECYTMRHVLERGRRPVSRYRGMGKVGMQILNELLKKYECEFLFV